MAVVTPDGIVGKVVDAYPTASLVMLITDPTFAAGVISQKNRVHGTLKGQGQAKCLVDYVQNEEKVETANGSTPPATIAFSATAFPWARSPASTMARPSRKFTSRRVAMQGGVEEVLIMLQGVHQQIPDGEVATPGYKILRAPPASVGEAQQRSRTGHGSDYRCRSAARAIQTIGRCAASRIRRRLAWLEAAGFHEDSKGFERLRRLMPRCKRRSRGATGQAPSQTQRPAAPGADGERHSAGGGRP